MKYLITKLLKKTEKFTKTDMLYLVKGGSWLTAGQFITSGTAFLLAIAFANLLPQTTYGTYKYILSIATLLTIFTLPGLHTAVTQALASDKKINTIKLTLSKIRYGLTASFFSLALAAYYFFQSNNIFAACLLIIAVFLPLVEGLTLFSATLNGLERFKELTKVNSLLRIIHSVVLVVLLFITDNIVILILGYFLTVFIIRLLASWKINHQFPGEEREYKGIVKYGLHLSIADFVNIIGAQIDKILVYHFLGAAELAVYFMALTPVDQVKQMVKNILPLALPKLSQRSTQSLDKALDKKLFIAFLAGTALTLVYLLLAPLFFKYVMPQYIASTSFSMIYSFMIVLQSVSSVIAVFLRSQKMIRIIHQASVIQNVSLLILILFFGYFYGMTGVILAKIFSMLVSIFCRYIFWKRTVNNIV